MEDLWTYGVIEQNRRWMLAYVQAAIGDPLAAEEGELSAAGRAVWVRLSRVGSLVTASTSTDGSAETPEEGLRGRPGEGSVLGERADFVDRGSA
jgi:hypothetical protein